MDPFHQDNLPKYGTGTSFTYTGPRIRILGAVPSILDELVLEGVAFVVCSLRQEEEEAFYFIYGKV